MFKNYDDILTVDDLKEILKIGRNVAYALVNNGTIKSIRINRQFRIPKQFLMDYLFSDYEDCVMDKGA